MKTMVTRLTSLAFCALTATAQAAVTSYDAASAFSIVNGNPNAPWTYGSLTAIDSPFTTFAESLTILGLTSWRRNEAGLGAPGFYFNPTGSTFFDGQTTLFPGQLMCAPGNSSMCTLRFTAPITGIYEIKSSFIGAITAGGKVDRTTTDVLISKDGVSLTPVLAVRGTGAASEKTFETSLHLNLGSTIDFAISGAGDGFASDSTGMDVTISLVPEPDTYAIMFAGLSLIAFAVRHRRRPQGRGSPH